ncbi:hypothetical protein AB4144_16220, partial [Rhizobiaceae sp. 2RAB30]
FGPSDAWRGAPMLSSAAAGEIAEISAAIRSAWLAFVRTGSPNSRALPQWRPFTPERPCAMRLAGQSHLHDMKLGS